MRRGKKMVHFVGIGGIGMSAIAKILLEMGTTVSGSDLETSALTGKLVSLGAKIFKGHHESHLPKGAGLVVYSSSIDMRNPEIVAAKRAGVPVIQRAQALGELLNCRKAIAVTGTHGKTTTTSLIAVMLERAHFDPTVAIGGEVEFFHSNAKWGRGEWMVAEADESDGSFRHLRPTYSVVTNIEMEHVDYYTSLRKVIDGYARFVNNTREDGAFFYNNDDANIKTVLKYYRGECRNYGFSRDSMMHPEDISIDRFRTSYRCVYRGRSLGEVVLRLSGRHNVLNSMAAILVGLEMGIEFKAIVASLADFEGAKRRFQLKYEGGGIMLVDDYAHHPTEIKAVIEAARTWRARRLIAVFQPHRFTRTKYLKKEFGPCFRGVDRLILTDIYAASERPLKGVSIRTIYDEVKKTGLRDVEIMKKEEIPERLAAASRSGDMIIVMGAGDIKKVADILAGDLRMRSDLGGIGGRIFFNEPLSRHTTFRIGGPADAWVEPRGPKELKDVLRLCARNAWKVFVIGNGSNLLAGEGGWRGVVISLGAPYFRSVRFSGTKVTVGAGFPLGRLIRMACARGLGGLESLVGIPGTAGGAIAMNAGGAANPLFTNIGELVSTLRVIDRAGRERTLSRKDIVFGYRSSGLGDRIILGATLKLSRSDRAVLVSRACDFLDLKRSKQVLDMPSAGCIFKNPDALHFTAGQLIDMMGFKGKRAGGAMVSRKHANFIVNTGSATCADVMELAGAIRKKAREMYHVALEMEVKVL